MAVAAFPADDPIWNTGGLNRTTPTPTKQGIGWTIEEEPPSGYFNWWMFYVSEYVQHYKAAIVAMDNAKVNRAGDTGMSGTFSPTSDGSGALGSPSFRWGQIDATGLRTSFLDPTVLVGVARLGTLVNPWLTANINLVTVQSSIVPNNAGGSSNGTDSKPWSAVVARAMRARTIRPTTAVSIPGNAGALTDITQNKSLVAFGTFDFAGGGLPGQRAGGSNFNINTVARTSGGAAAGDVTIGLVVPIDANAVVVLTHLDIPTAELQRAMSYSIASDGSSIRVRIRSVTTTPLLVDAGFSLLAIGLPFAAVADPIS